MTLKDVSLEDRPYERAQKYGLENLADYELLSIILRTGTMGEKITDISQRVLALNAGRGLQNLCDLSLKDFQNLRGIGKVKAIQLKVIAEIAKRIYLMDKKAEIKFDSPETIARYYQVVYKGMSKENLNGLLLNSKLELLEDVLIQDGNLDSLTTSSSQIFKQAVIREAKYLILVHNHPSGNFLPSREDIETTKRIIKCGKLLGISLLDHLIVVDDGYYSMRENIDIFEKM